jgi:hypothetical protein
MMNLYAYIAEALNPSGCNSCQFSAIHDKTDLNVSIHASICGDGQLDVNA